MHKSARLYLVMMTLFNFAFALSGIFVNIFIWNIEKSFSLLAINSLTWSLAILLGLPISSWYGRKYSPLASSRVGILFFILAYGVLLYFREDTVNHIIEYGILMGLGSSFFLVGQHMQAMDSAEDEKRDRFLYTLNFLTSCTGLIGPVLSGFIIEKYSGMSGYYVVFGMAFIAFLLTILTSLKIKGSKIPKRSYFKEVWRNPSREWRWMYWISIGTSIVEGTYMSFLVSVMTFSILQNELSLGGYNMFAALMAILSSLVLARISRSEWRLKIYTWGAALLSISSILLSLYPSFWMLAGYAVLSAVSLNLINTTLHVWMYASIEADPHYRERRLDYVIIREIPLGIGRSIGVALFFLLQAYFTAEKILPISFALFGSVFLLLVPSLNKIWGVKGKMQQKSTA
ncbi:MAG: MFS transporter [Ectobacillus sp.]